MVVHAYGLKTEPAFCMFLSWGQRGGVGWGGVGWGDNVHLHFVTYMMLRYCASHI